MESTVTFAVLDIDGVLADVGHRRHHLEGRRRDWASFFAAAGDDPPLPRGVDLAHALAAAHPVVYLSGRPEWLRRVTQDWLHRHDLPAGDLVLRPDGDHRPARHVKLEALRTIASVAPIEVLVDDDDDVVAAVRSAVPPVVGEVLHADWQPGGARVRRTLHRAQEVDGLT